jgi:hypothetical protein
MTLLDEIQAACTPEQIAARGDVGGLEIIAATVSVGRTHTVSLDIGVGDVLVALAPDGGTWLDEMTTLGGSNANAKWAMELIRQGRLNAGAPATNALASAMGAAAGGLIQSGITTLLALAVAPNPATEQQCSVAMQGL